MLLFSNLQMLATPVVSYFKIYYILHIMFNYNFKYTLLKLKLYSSNKNYKLKNTDI